MATVKYRIRSTKSEQATIYVRVSVKRGLQLQTSTGLKIAPNEWKSSNKVMDGTPKNISTPHIKNLKTDLKKLEAHIASEINYANANGIIINSDWLTERINDCFGRVSETETNKPFISYWIQDFIDNAHTFDNPKGGIGLSNSRIDSYKTLKKQLIQFNKDLLVIDCNINMFDRIKKWFLDKKYSTTTINKKLSDVRTICKYAQSKGIEISNQLSVVKIKKGNPYDDDMDVIILTEPEIKKIESLKLTNASLINARKWLILACYTGQRGAALTNNIKLENFHTYKNNLIIRFKQAKGNKMVTIPVLPKVKEIYDNGLPHKISIQKLNSYFKKIGEKAELNEIVMGTVREKIELTKTKSIQRNVKKERPKWMYLSTHIGRRSFASNHYNKLPTPLIMKVTGHKKESTFLMYINQKETDHLDHFFDYYKNEEVKNATITTNNI